MRGNVMLSSPERTLKSGPHARMTWVIWSSEPDASFTPTMFGQSLTIRTRVSVSTLTAVRPWMLYKRIGMSTASATAEMPVQPLLRRPIVVRVHHQSAVGTGLLGMRGQLYGFGRRVRTGPRDHRDAPTSRFDDDLDHALVLGM